jgi:bacterioferritin (cytochrome b1)
LIPKMIDAMKSFYGLDLSKPIDGLVQSEARFSNALTRLLDAIDKAFNITGSWAAALDKLAGMFNWVGQNIDIVTKVLGIGGFLTAIAMAVPLIQSITLALVGMNTALFTTGGVLGLFVKLAVVAAGIGGGIALMNMEFDQQKTALQGSMPQIEAYIKAMQGQKVQIKATTDQYVDYAEKVKETAAAQLVAANEAYDAAQTWNNVAKSDAAKKRLLDAHEAFKQADDLVARIKKIQAMPTSNPLEKALPDEKGAKKQANAIREVTEEITKYEKELAGIQGGPDAQRFQKEQAEVTKELETWKDKLDDAGVSSERVTKLIDRLRNAFVGVKTATREMERIVTPLQFVQTAFEKFADTGVSKFTDALFEGTLSMKTLGDVGVSVAKDLFKEFIKLAAVAPLKNLLFGGTDKTFGLLSTGSPGIGGLIGGLFGAGGGATGLGGVNSGLANAVAATTKGFGSALGNVFDGGLSSFSNSIVSRPTMFRFARGAGLMGEAGPEAVMPLTRLSGGKLGVSADMTSHAPQTVVQIVNQNGSRVEQRRQRRGNQEIVKVMIKDVMMDDLASNGEYARANQRLYGTSRMGGRR